MATSVTEALEKRINTPLSSGCGRLFDGVAAITGLCMRASFHAEGPMRLESALAHGISDRYEVEIRETLVFRQHPPADRAGSDAKDPCTCHLCPVP